jgi:hypothetical protein
MKAVLIIFLLSYACTPHRAEVAHVSAEAAVTDVEDLVFDKDIQPILESHCKPCHFKDGKMYERMPFDQSKTLVDFQEGILRRMKDENEVAKIKEYLAQLK